MAHTHVLTCGLAFLCFLGSHYASALEDTSALLHHFEVREIHSDLRMISDFVKEGRGGCRLSGSHPIPICLSRRQTIVQCRPCQPPSESRSEELKHIMENVVYRHRPCMEG
jgi:hypothetical protein